MLIVVIEKVEEKPVQCSEEQAGAWNNPGEAATLVGYITILKAVLPDDLRPSSRADGF